MADHRTTDAGHVAECFQLHHKSDNRITVLETRMDSLKDSVDVIIVKHQDENEQLNKLTVLFERFFTKFENHIDMDEQRQDRYDKKLESLTNFHARVDAIWAVVRIAAVVAVVVIGAFYTLSKDTGIVPHIQDRQTTTQPGG